MTRPAPALIRPAATLFEGAAAELTDQALGPVIRAFYARVRADSLLGPLFNQAVGDWPAHEAVLIDFWHSVINTSGRYKGPVLERHLRHKGRITQAMVARWLALWGETAHQLLPATDALRLTDRAARIAKSLSLALFDDPLFHPGPRPVAPAHPLPTGPKPPGHKLEVSP